MTTGQTWLESRKSNAALTAKEIIDYVDHGGKIYMEVWRKPNQAVMSRFYTEEYTNDKVFFQLNPKTCHKLISDCVVWPIEHYMGMLVYQKDQR